MEKEFKIPLIETDATIPKPVFGNEIHNAPQPALTAANSNSFVVAAAPDGGGGSFMTSANTTIIDNMRTRINELEEKLKKLELLK